MTYEAVISVCGLAVWVWFFRHGRRALPRGAEGDVPWRGTEVLMLALFFVVALGGSHALMALAAGGRGEATAALPADDDEQAKAVAYQVATAALANGLTVILALAAAGRYGQRGLGALGLRSRPVLEHVILGFAGFFAVLPVLVALNFALARLAPLLRYEVRVQDVVKLFVTAPRTPSYALVVLYAVVGAPLAEEILFRGFVQGYFRRLLPPGGAVLVAAVTFALFHQPIHAAVAVFFLGVILGYERERTRSLLAPILTHVLFNLHTFLTTQVMWT